MTDDRPIVAAFDLDGTLTKRDTLLPFLAFVSGRVATGNALVRLSVPIALALTGRGSRQGAKERLLERLLRGRPLAELEAAAQIYVDEIMRTGLRPWVRSRIAWHREQGHEVVVVTASPELYVAELGRRLGVDMVLGTRLEVDDSGCLTGRVVGLNCRGAEKVVRLRDWLGDRDVRVVAYGDSAGDDDLLAFADVAVRIGRGTPAQPVLALAGS